MNANLTAKIKEYAYELGADLIGVAPIKRFEKAPIQMSPQGILPTATCVIVCAIHHPDIAMELGGEKHPQIQGPYTVQYTMNTKLDYMAYHIANQLDALGYDAIPIASSNIWRYREIMGLNACFAPDMSHIYAATCAGIGQLGWNGLTMSPEYGPWNRFISIITDAPLEGTPMYEDMTLCDRCGECIRHCPTDAFRKEVKGVKVIEPEGRRFEFANKNLWRCAWGEHFNLDLDLPIPDVVDEKVLLETIDKHGMRGGEMGCCLKFCLPKHLRLPGGDFTTTYQRKKQNYANLELPVHRRMYDDIASFVRRYAVDEVAFLDEETIDGLNAKETYSKARGAVVYAIRYQCAEGNMTREEQLAHHAAGHGLGGLLATERTAMHQMNIIANLDITRILDNFGYLSMCNTGVDETIYAKAAGLLQNTAPKGEDAYAATSIDATQDSSKRFDDGSLVEYGVVLTDAPFRTVTKSGLQEPILHPRKTLTENVVEYLREEGSDQIAVIAAARMDALADTLEEQRGGEKLILAHDKNGLYTPFEAETVEYERHARHTADYLKGAKNVILFAHHFPQVVTKRTIQPPAYAAGPYLFALYEMTFELGYSALKVCKYLQSLGYSAVMSYDLTGMGGNIATPRGQLPDAFCNSLEAVEAGLGALAENGVCYTAEHGFSQGFMAIVTDAPLETCTSAASIPDTKAACIECGVCASACPACAISTEKKTITLNGTEYAWRTIDWTRCDWAKRYALCGEEGSKYTSSKTDVQVPGRVTEGNLTAALKGIDRVLKFRPTTTQRCVIDCKLVKLLR
ncbi:MAG: 4Fe-4S binding protein [Clostridiaceae bacterium]|nr:4Fe-4S binding protein [Clostridiaceae bacterium]